MWTGWESAITPLNSDANHGSPLTHRHSKLLDLPQDTQGGKALVLFEQSHPITLKIICHLPASRLSLSHFRYCYYNSKPNHKRSEGWPSEERVCACVYVCLSVCVCLCVCLSEWERERTEKERPSSHFGWYRKRLLHNHLVSLKSISTCLSGEVSQQHLFPLRKGKGLGG